MGEGLGISEKHDVGEALLSRGIRGVLDFLASLASRDVLCGFANLQGREIDERRDESRASDERRDRDASLGSDESRDERHDENLGSDESRGGRRDQSLGGDESRDACRDQSLASDGSHGTAECRGSDETLLSDAMPWISQTSRLLATGGRILESLVNSALRRSRRGRLQGRNCARNIPGQPAEGGAAHDDVLCPRVRVARCARRVAEEAGVVVRKEARSAVRREVQRKLERVGWETAAVGWAKKIVRAAGPGGGQATPDRWMSRQDPRVPEGCL